ncbi:PLP-dependent transferase, partial [Microvirga zambiensis]|uniref:PLP-dependent transferase n=1 Tax=Microvirga zambiensis TaxID=1402137 RepID=UPI00191CB420
MNDQTSVCHDATLALHAGAGPREVGAPASSPLVMATSFFTHPDAVGFSANDLKEAAPHFYTRWSNPILDQLETRLTALESGEAGLSFASGMAAISALFLDRLGGGDHLVLSNVCYYYCVINFVWQQGHRGSLRTRAQMSSA